jgi:hypothetical protein
VAVVWLKSLCTIAGCREQDVWCIPGNHDVDRDVFDDSLFIRQLHENLRVENPDDVDEKLTECMRDTAGAVELLRSIQNYNNFAAKFSCQSRANPLAWHHKLELNDGSKLILLGANSTLVSDKTDDNEGQRLLLGTIQSRPAATPGVTYVFMSHHPPDWLRDYDNVNMNLDARAKVQLFGHKHLQVIEERNGCVRVVAGAVHPSRKEQKWRPRYNWIVLSVDGTGDNRRLKVDVYPRAWNDARPEYIADVAWCTKGKDYRDVALSLESWTGGNNSDATVSLVANQTRVASVTSAAPQEGPVLSVRGMDMDADRTLTYRFLSLSHVARIEVAHRLHLLEDSDEGVMDSELFERIFRRAVSRKQLGQLWAEVEAEHGDGQNPSNPYVGK